MKSVVAFILLSSSVVFATEPPLTSIDFSPTGQVVATSQAGVHVYSWPQIKLERTIAVRSANLHAIRFSPDSRRFAVGGGDPAELGQVEIFNWPDGASVASLDGHEDSVRSLVWTDDSTIVAGSLDRQVTIWNVSQPGKPTVTLNGHSRGINAVSLLPDRKTLVTAGVDQSLRVWNSETGDLIRSMNQHTRPIHALALRSGSSGLPMMASSAADRTIRFWQPSIGRMVRYVRLETSALDIAWLHDGVQMVAGCTDGNVRVIDTENVRVVETRGAIKGWIYAIAIHPNDSSVVVAGSNGQLKRLEFKK